MRAPWELAFLMVGVIEHGLRTRFEGFEPDDEESARAAYDALEVPADLVADRDE